MNRHEWNIRFRTAEEKSAVVRKIKIFAVSRGLTLAKALDYLADMAGHADDREDQKQSGTGSAFKPEIDRVSRPDRALER